MSKENMIRKLMKESCGVTLVETLVSLGLIGITMGFFGSGIFQALSIEKFWLDDVVATREARHAGSWFAGDVFNTEEVCDPATSAELPPDQYSMANSVTLVWFDLQGAGTMPVAFCDTSSSPDYIRYAATYQQLGPRLIRTLVTDDNGTITSEAISLSRRISLARFKRSTVGDTMILELDVEAERDTLDTFSVDTFLRRLRS